MSFNKPKSFSFAGGSNEEGSNQVFNPGSIKEIIKRTFKWDDETLNDFKDLKTNETFFNNLNVRKILMFLGTEIGRDTHMDIHVANHIENTINEIDNGVEIKPIVSVVGYAGSGKDYLIDKLNGDFATTGDVRFENELKYVLIVNKYFDNPKKLKEELLKLVSDFTFDPDLIYTKTYSYLLGNGQEETVSKIIERIDSQNITTFEGFVEIYKDFEKENKIMPTINEILVTMGFTRNDIVYECYESIFNKAGVNAEDDEKLQNFHFFLDEDYNLDFKINKTTYVKKNGEFVEEDRVEGFEDKEKIYPEDLNIKEFLIIEDEIMKNFDNKMKLFNPNGKYCDGPVESQIIMNKEDYEDLQSNNIILIHKPFFTPTKPDFQNISELEDGLVNYHLKQVFKVGFGVKNEDEYETQMRNSFKNLQEVFSDEFSLLNEKEKVSYLIELLNKYGITRGNPKHPSETMPEIMVENGVEAVENIPFVKSKNVIQTIVDSNNNTISNRKRRIPE